MKTHAILSAMGGDRVGVADDLADVLQQRGIEIEESRMTSLKGRFAMILEVCGERGLLVGLRRDLAMLGRNLGCRFQLELPGVERPEPRSAGIRYSVEAFTRGASGIHAITGLLKRHGANIENLETESVPASWTSALNFQMRARITVPAGCSLTRLREELRQMETEWNLDGSIRPLGLGAESAVAEVLPDVVEKG